MDTKGNVQWERTYGGERNDHGGHGIQTRDGGYIITGSRLVFKPIAGARAGDHPNTEFTKTVIWLIRTDAKGDVRWEKTFDMPSKGWGRGYSVREEADEGFVILGGMDNTGEQSGEAYLIGTDSKGNIQWQVQFGGPGSGLTDAKTFVRVDDGYVVLGSIINTELLKTMQETKLRAPPAGSSLFGSVVVKVRK
jgi:hypothetical protein